MSDVDEVRNSRDLEVLKFELEKRRFTADIVNESEPVYQAMIGFRTSLVAAEQKPDDVSAWRKVNDTLIFLAETLRDETPNYSKPCA